MLCGSVAWPRRARTRGLPPTDGSPCCGDPPNPEGADVGPFPCCQRTTIQFSYPHEELHCNLLQEFHQWSIRIVSWWTRLWSVTVIPERFSHKESSSSSLNLFPRDGASWELNSPWQRTCSALVCAGFIGRWGTIPAYGWHQVGAAGGGQWSPRPSCPPESSLPLLPTEVDLVSEATPCSPELICNPALSDPPGSWVATDTPSMQPASTRISLPDWCPSTMLHEKQCS